MSKKAYGIFINIEIDTLKNINELMLSDAEEKTEVVVKFLGQERKFTLKEFINMLGFDFIKRIERNPNKNRVGIGYRED